MGGISGSGDDCANGDGVGGSKHSRWSNLFFFLFFLFLFFLFFSSHADTDLRAKLIQVASEIPL